MTLEEARLKLEEHFWYLLDDSNQELDDPILYSAVMTMVTLFDYCEKFEDKFGSLDAALDKAYEADGIVHCGECYHYDSENLLCHRWGLEKPVITIKQGYCSCGTDRETMEKCLAACRENGGWATPGIILSADEVKKAIKRSKETGDEYQQG